MLPWAAFAFLLLVAGGMYLWKDDLARFQSLIVGGRVRPGCVLAEIAVLVALAVLVLLMRRAVI